MVNFSSKQKSTKTVLRDTSSCFNGFFYTIIFFASILHNKKFLVTTNKKKCCCVFVENCIKLLVCKHPFKVIEIILWNSLKLLETFLKIYFLTLSRLTQGGLIIIFRKYSTKTFFAVKNRRNFYSLQSVVLNPKFGAFNPTRSGNMMSLRNHKTIRKVVIFWVLKSLLCKGEGDQPEHLEKERNFVNLVT